MNDDPIELPGPLLAMPEQAGNSAVVWLVVGLLLVLVVTIWRYRSSRADGTLSPLAHARCALDALASSPSPQTPSEECQAILEVLFGCIRQRCIGDDQVRNEDGTSQSLSVDNAKAFHAHRDWVVAHCERVRFDGYEQTQEDRQRLFERVDRALAALYEEGDSTS